MHDSLVRTVEIPQDTPPGHYAKEAHRITLNHMVQLQTSLSQIPRGAQRACQGNIFLMLALVGMHAWSVPRVACCC